MKRLLDLYTTRPCDTRCVEPGVHNAHLTLLGRWRYVWSFRLRARLSH